MSKNSDAARPAPSLANCHPTNWMIQQLANLFLSTFQDIDFSQKVVGLNSVLKRLRVPKLAPLRILQQTLSHMEKVPSNDVASRKRCASVIRTVARFTLLEELNMFSMKAPDGSNSYCQPLARCFLHLLSMHDVLILCARKSERYSWNFEVQLLEKCIAFACHAVYGSAASFSSKPEFKDFYLFGEFAQPAKLQILRMLTNVADHLYLKHDELAKMISYIDDKQMTLLLNNYTVELMVSFRRNVVSPKSHVTDMIESFGLTMAQENEEESTPKVNVQTPVNELFEEIGRVASEIFHSVMLNTGTFHAPYDAKLGPSFSQILSEIQYRLTGVDNVKVITLKRKWRFTLCWLTYRQTLLSCLVAAVQKIGKQFVTLPQILGPDFKELCLTDNLTIDAAASRFCSVYPVEGNQENRLKTCLLILFSRRPGDKGCLRMPTSLCTAAFACSKVFANQTANAAAFMSNDPPFEVPKKNAAQNDVSDGKDTPEAQESSLNTAGNTPTRLKASAAAFVPASSALDNAEPKHPKMTLPQFKVRFVTPMEKVHVQQDKNEKWDVPASSNVSCDDDDDEKIPIHIDSSLFPSFLSAPAVQASRTLKDTFFEKKENLPQPVSAPKATSKSEFLQDQWRASLERPTPLNTPVITRRMLSLPSTVPKRPIVQYDVPKFQKPPPPPRYQPPSPPVLTLGAPAVETISNTPLLPAQSLSSRLLTSAVMSAPQIHISSTLEVLKNHQKQQQNMQLLQRQQHEVQQQPQPQVQPQVQLEMQQEQPPRRQRPQRQNPRNRNRRWQPQQPQQQQQQHYAPYVIILPPNHTLQPQTYGNSSVPNYPATSLIVRPLPTFVVAPDQWSHMGESDHLNIQ